MSITFTIEGQPVQKGSTHSFVHKHTQKIITLQTNSQALKPWVEKVRYAAREAKVEMRNGAVAIVATFYMRPSKAIEKKTKDMAREMPANISRPDVDKLARSVLDALMGVAYQDDSQVTAILCRKKYAERQGKERTEIEIK